MHQSLALDVLLQNLPEEECFTSAAEEHGHLLRLDAVDSDRNSLLCGREQLELAEPDVEGRALESAVWLSNDNDVDASTQSCLQEYTKLH